MTPRARVIAALLGLIAWLAPACPAGAQEMPEMPTLPEAGRAATSDDRAEKLIEGDLDANSALPDLEDLVAMIDRKSRDANAVDGQKDWSSPIRLAVVFAGLAILPSLLVMVTSFTRIVIVLSFVRRALTTQTIPPTAAVIGLALFLTLFTMAPTMTEVNARAVQPYIQEKITFDEALKKGTESVKAFMLRQTRTKDLELFVNMAKLTPEDPRDVPVHVVVPAFAISEFRTAFEMGCLLFIPFLLIDLVIAGILLSAGMMMLPPAMISLPFKIVLFVLVDGWTLVVETLVRSFR
jgi:flagellar biosynthetic protein FliP